MNEIEELKERVKKLEELCLKMLNYMSEINDAVISNSERALQDMIDNGPKY